MDGNVLTILGYIGTALAVLVAARFFSKRNILSTAKEVIDLFEVKVALLEEELAKKDVSIQELQTKLDYLETLVTKTVDLQRLEAKVDRIVLVTNA